MLVLKHQVRVPLHEVSIQEPELFGRGSTVQLEDPLLPFRVDGRELLYEPVKASQLDAVRILDENPNRAAWLLLSLKPPRKALPQAPAPPRRAPKASSAPRPFAPSRFRRNHQAMSNPPQDADGNYPCAHKCGRVFGHAPASVWRLCGNQPI